MDNPRREPKFGAGIFCQCLPQRLPVGKGDYLISRRMDQENGNRGIADSLCRCDIAQVDAEKKVGPETDEIGHGIIEQGNSKELKGHVAEIGVTGFGYDRADLGSFLDGH